MKLHMHGPQPKAREGKPKRSGERGGEGDEEREMERVSRYFKHSQSRRIKRWRELVGVLSPVNFEGLYQG